MALINCITAVINGDRGGLGMSRFYATNADFSALGSADSTTMASAITTMYGTLHTYFPSYMTYGVNPTYQCYDIATGALDDEDAVGTVPEAATGSAITDAFAGIGVRLYWHTATVKNRRLIRGATFMTPVVSTYCDGGGGVTTGCVSAMVDAANLYLNTLATADLQPCIYSRPKTTTSGDGVAAPVLIATAGTTPASLRSRRV